MKLERIAVVLVFILVSLCLGYFLSPRRKKCEIRRIAPLRLESPDSSVGACEPGMSPMPRHERRYNSIPTEYDPCLKQWLERVLREKPPADDPLVVDLIKELLEPPSTNMPKASRTIVETPQSTEILERLNGREKGFFIEAGGLDGERSSNTIWLERYKKWTGVLIEMDPFFYTMLKGHNRKSWSINCCISPENSTVIANFKQHGHGSGKLTTRRTGMQVPCFPIYSILLALGNPHIDFFSLDVEGFELPILKTIPFDKVSIDSLAVEYVHGTGKGEGYKEFMATHGYNMVKQIDKVIHSEYLSVHDYIFVKR